MTHRRRELGGDQAQQDEQGQDRTVIGSDL